MTNPFEDDDPVGQHANPFADAAVTKALTETADEDYNYTYSQPPPSSSIVPPSYNYISSSSKNNDDKPWKHQSQPSQSEAEIMAIARQKQEMMEREEELERQRQALAAAQSASAAAQPQPAGAPPPPPGARVNNWPPCYPFMYHSIKDDIPVQDQRMVRSLYYSWFLNVVCYIVNTVACMCILIAGVTGKDFGWSIMYIVFNIPLSFFLHYRPVYYAYQKDSSFYFYVFFFFGGWHVLWMAYIVLGIQESGSAGMINTIYVFGYNNGSHKGEASVVLVAMLLWFVNLATFAFLFFKVWRHYKLRGHTFAEARNQAFASAAQNPAVQQAAVGAATAYVTNQMANPYQRQVDEEV